MRDIEAAYKDALIEEHAGYVRAGRTAEAEHVAEVLKDRYDHDVAKSGPGASAASGPEKVETTAAARPPEAAVESKPPAKKVAASPKTAAKKAAASNPGDDSGS